MLLTTAQLQTLKAWVIANANSVFDQGTANTLNASASPDYFAWKTNIAKQNIDDLIDKAAFTPSDAIPISPSTDLTYSNRAFLAQLKQSNAQWLISGIGAINASLASVRKNFQDCLRQIPTGSNGANQDAGWGTGGSPGAVRLAMMRPITVGEKLFSVEATGPGNDGGTRGLNTHPDNFAPSISGAVAEGPVTLENLVAAANS